MVIDSNGNMFEERRKKDRRKAKSSKQVGEDNRKKDRRDPKNSYKI